jgi:exodeoxyribonuclease V gamma subunit
VGHPSLDRWLRHQIADEVGVIAGLDPIPFPEGLDRLCAPAARSGAHDWNEATAGTTEWTADALAARLLDRWAEALASTTLTPALAPLMGMLQGLPDRAEHTAVALASQVADALLDAARSRPADVVAWATAPQASTTADPPAWLRWSAAALGLQRAGPAADRLALLNGGQLNLKGPPLVLVGPGLMSDTEAALLRAAAAQLEVHLFLPAGAWPGANRAVGEACAKAIARWPEAMWLTSSAAGGADPEPLLATLQAQLRGEGSDPLPAGALPAPTLHAAWSPLREVEALRDHLLERLAAGASPRDVLVLTPDLETYAPLVQSVFAQRGGRGADEEGSPAAEADAKPEAKAKPEGKAKAKTDPKVKRAPAIPVRIGGLGLRATNPVADALLQVLGLALDRVTAPGLLNLLRLSVVQARFGIDDASLPELEALLRESNARWGADGDEKAAIYGAAPTPALHSHSLRFGLERAALSLVLPDDDPHWSAVADDAQLGLASPFRADQRGSAPLIGVLHSILIAVDGARARLGATTGAPGAGPARPAARSAGAWRADLSALRDAFTQTDGALAWLRVEVDEALAAALPDGATVPRSATAVRRALQGRFEQPAREKPTNADAVTLARLDAEGVTPAPIVALLGMSGGAFPRVPQRPDWDPRRDEAEPVRQPSLRDRYALGCAVAWAREGLWISYVGRAPRRGEELPPCVPVAELFARLGAPKGVHPFTEGARHPWQPDALPRWDADLGKPPEQADAQRGTPAPGAPRRSWTIDELVARLLNPARALLTERLGLYVPDDEEPLSDREPIDFGGLDGWAVRNDLLQSTWVCPAADEGGRPPLLRGAEQAKATATKRLAAQRKKAIGAGELPPGGAGESALDAALADVHVSIDSYYGFDAAKAEPQVKLQHTLKLNDQDVELVGQVEAVLSSASGQKLHLWLTASSNDREKPTLRAWLHLLLAWAAEDGVVGSCVVGKKGKANYLWPDKTAPKAEAQAALCALVELAEACGREPMPLFKRTSRAFAEVFAQKPKTPAKNAKTAEKLPSQESKLAKAVDKANTEWFGSAQSPYPPERIDRWIAALHPDWTPEHGVCDVNDGVPAPGGFVENALLVWAGPSRGTKTDAAGFKLATTLGVTQ